MITLQDFQLFAIKRGIESAKRDESGVELMGALEGFDVCVRLVKPEEFMEAIEKCHKEEREALQREDKGRGGLYRRLRYKTLQVEWIFELMKVAWGTAGIKVGNTLSSRAVMKYHEFFDEMERLR